MRTKPAAVLCPAKRTAEPAAVLYPVRRIVEPAAVLYPARRIVEPAAVLCPVKRTAEPLVISYPVTGTGRIAMGVEARVHGRCPAPPVVSSAVSVRVQVVVGVCQNMEQKTTDAEGPHVIACARRNMKKHASTEELPALVSVCQNMEQVHTVMKKRSTIAQALPETSESENTLVESQARASKSSELHPPR